jgi:hypothetical protein
VHAPQKGARGAKRNARRKKGRAPPQKEARAAKGVKGKTRLGFWFGSYCSDAPTPRLTMWVTRNKARERKERERAQKKLPNDTGSFAVVRVREREIEGVEENTTAWHGGCAIEF